jgi:hypothetical protein
MKKESEGILEGKEKRVRCIGVKEDGMEVENG